MVTRTVLGLCFLVLVVGGCSESSDAGGSGAAGSGAAGSGGGAGTNSGGSAGDGGGGTGECFAPNRNLDEANSEEMPGCACVGDGSACVDGVALVCEEDHWVSVIDGPCMPTPELECEGRLDSVMDCLDLFIVCVELDTGSFCGTGSRSGDCAGGEIVQRAGDCMVDDAYCLELPNGFYCTGPGTASCPDGYVSVTDGSCEEGSYDCFHYSEELACRIPTLRLSECQDAGGIAYADPGDGSLREAGCADAMTAIGFISGLDYDEGGLCCAEL